MVKASQTTIFAPLSECPVTYFKCTKCGSLNEFTKSSGFYDSKIDPTFAHYYVDVGAGVEEIIDPLARISQLFTKGRHNGLPISLLELGCGCGFGVHYATAIQEWNATGIEPGGYGAIGRSELGAIIHTQPLGQGSPADGTLFDIIYASEVIEHISDPKAFLGITAMHLKDDGVLVLTTPLADFISEDNPSNEVYASLFPGEHKIILSENGVFALLRESGFQHIKVERRTPANIVIQASKRTELHSLYHSADDALFSRSEAIRYLRLFNDSSRLRQPLRASTRVKLAMTTRLIKVLTNAGEIQAAAELIRASTPQLIQCLQIKSIDGHTCQLYTPDIEPRIVPKSVFTACLLSISQESLLTTSGLQPYPKEGLAFAKNLGFYACMVLLNNSKPACSAELRDAGRYLESFIDHALEMRNSPSSIYFIEFIDMLGPALTCLLLIRIRLGLPADLADFPEYSEKWFSARYQRSYNDILGLTTSKDKPIEKEEGGHRSTFKSRLWSLSRRLFSFTKGA